MVLIYFFNKNEKIFKKKNKIKFDVEDYVIICSYFNLIYVIYIIDIIVI